MFTATFDPVLDFHDRSASGNAGTGPAPGNLLLLFLVGVSGIGGGSGSLAVALRPRLRVTSGEEMDFRLRNPKLRREEAGLGGDDDAVATTTSTAAARLWELLVDIRGREVYDLERGREDEEMGAPGVTGPGATSSKRPCSSTVYWLAGCSSPDASVTSGEPGMVDKVCPRGYDGAGARLAGLEGVVRAELCDEPLWADCPDPVRACDLEREGVPDADCVAVVLAVVDEMSPMHPFEMLPPFKSDHERRLPAADF
jgi:hypothetical protein